jgi:hypothetical protein
MRLCPLGHESLYDGGMEDGMVQYDLNARLLGLGDRQRARKMGEYKQNMLNVSSSYYWQENLPFKSCDYSNKSVLLEP